MFFAPIHNFNSHAHVERDVIHAFIINDNMHFNSHAHVERDIGIGINAAIIYNFNSHAHVERDMVYVRYIS